MLAHKELLNKDQVTAVIRRLALVVIENHHLNFQDTVIIGMQPRGVFLSNRIIQEINHFSSGKIKFEYGKLDNTFYRDDVRSNKEILLPTETDIPFSIENKNVILVDDVLHTGRSVRSAIDALLDFGRPAKVELLVLIDRLFSRELPVQPDYTGLSVDTLYEQKVKVLWQEKDSEDSILLIG